MEDKKPYQRIQAKDRRAFLMKDHRGETYIIFQLHLSEAKKTFRASAQKYSQLEREIREDAPITDKLHTLSKFWMFVRDEFIPEDVR